MDQIAYPDMLKHDYQCDLISWITVGIGVMTSIVAGDTMISTIAVHLTSQQMRLEITVASTGNSPPGHLQTNNSVLRRIVMGVAPEIRHGLSGPGVCVHLNRFKDGQNWIAQPGRGHLGRDLVHRHILIAWI